MNQNRRCCLHQPRPTRMDINQVDEKGITPLYAAAARDTSLFKYSDFKAVNQLLDRDDKTYLYESDDNGWTIFHYQALIKLFQLSLDFDARTCTRDEYTGPLYASDATPLFFAAAHAEDVRCLIFLLGARPNKPVLEISGFGSWKKAKTTTRISPTNSHQQPPTANIGFSNTKVVTRVVTLQKLKDTKLIVIELDLQASFSAADGVAVLK
ncbi:hypothetical protein ACHAQJ_006219 [Trichoderma viride]